MARERSSARMSAAHWLSGKLTQACACTQHSCHQGWPTVKYVHHLTADKVSHARSVLALSRMPQPEDAAEHGILYMLLASRASEPVPTEAQACFHAECDASSQCQLRASSPIALVARCSANCPPLRLLLLSRVACAGTVLLCCTLSAADTAAADAPTGHSSAHEGRSPSDLNAELARASTVEQQQQPQQQRRAYRPADTSEDLTAKFERLMGTAGHSSAQHAPASGPLAIGDEDAQEGTEHSPAGGSEHTGGTRLRWLCLDLQALQQLDEARAPARAHTLLARKTGAATDAELPLAVAHLQTLRSHVAAAVAGGSGMSISLAVSTSGCVYSDSQFQSEVCAVCGVH